MTDANEDKRSSPRAPIDLKVEYKKKNSFFADYTRNISRGGTFIKTKKPLPTGTQFLFKLVVPDRTEPFQLLGEVVWARSDGDEPGMGIRFVYADERQRENFSAVVEGMMAASLGVHLSERLLNKKFDPS